jgi:heterodisulfide reductase subunit A-like polyferredoxin
LKCYACEKETEDVKYTHIQDGRTYFNFPMNKCKSCGECTYAAGDLIYYPTYAKHFNLQEFDCDSISWNDLCEWIRNNKST